MVDLVDPTAENQGVDRKSLNSPIDSLENKRVGLLSNAKKGAEPLLETVEDRIDELYPSAEVQYYLVSELDVLKEDEELEAIEEWTDENDIDAAITALGDCGSCTKFLSWANNAMEEGGCITLGLVDEGFALDWQSNSIDLGRPLRYYKIPVKCEVRDKERIAESITQDVLEEMEAELARPLNEKESLEEA